MAVAFDAPLTDWQLRALIEEPTTHEPIELARADHQTVNAELGVIRTCRSQIFLATLTMIGVWVMGAVGLGLTNHLEKPLWIGFGASFPYLVLSISILCLIEKANSINNRKAFLAALEDDLRRNRCPTNYLGWNHLSVNHESCAARARKGLCIQNEAGVNSCCWVKRGEAASLVSSMMPINSALDRFGALAALVVAPLYIASSGLLFWYCVYHLLGSRNGLLVVLGIVVTLIAAFLIYNVWGMAKGKRSIVNRYVRWKCALSHCRKIDGMPAQFESPPLN